MRKVNYLDFALIVDRLSNLFLGSNATGREQPSKDAISNIQSTSPTPTPSSPPATNVRGMYFTTGIISAIISLFILPEIFGSLAIILGAYIWRKEQRNRGIVVLILGVICVIVGLEVTAIRIIDLLPS
jgi:hypothetical protein